MRTSAVWVHMTVTEMQPVLMWIMAMNAIAENLFMWETEHSVQVGTSNYCELLTCINLIFLIINSVEVDMCANENSNNCSTENNEVCVSTDTFPGYRCDCRTGFVNEIGTCIGMYS